MWYYGRAVPKVRKAHIHAGLLYWTRKALLLIILLNFSVNEVDNVKQREAEQDGSVAPHFSKKMHQWVDVFLLIDLNLGWVVDLLK